MTATAALAKAREDQPVATCRYQLWVARRDAVWVERNPPSAAAAIRLWEAAVGERGFVPVGEPPALSVTPTDVWVLGMVRPRR